MQILIAPNAFKNSLSATEAAHAIRKGLEQSKLPCTCTCFPIGDGGDGTARLLLEKEGAQIINTVVHDPLGRKINTSFGLVDGGSTAVIELADASGLRLLQAAEYAPLRASTYGTGELIKQALENGARKIIIGIGGSATVDGGVGILQALGVRFLDSNREPLNDIPGSLTGLEFVDTSALDKRMLNTELIVLCDVENTLLGDSGAAAVFAPQKGASPEAVKKLEASLGRLRDIALKQTGKDMAAIPRGGASGGVAAGLGVFLNARLVNGIEYFLDLTRFDEALEKTGLLITGEGSIDLQTLQGKAPFGVARRAKKKNIPVIGMAGRIPLEVHPELQQCFDVLIPINHELADIKTAMQHTAENLIRSGRMLGDLLSI